MTGVIRVGRGGAGNFIQQKDVDDAEKAAAVAAAAAAQDNDVEAQKPSSTPPPPQQQQQQAPPQYVRSGRGGAGNFAEPPTLAEAQASEDFMDRTDAAVSASQAGKPRSGLSGRGGAGNWTESAAEATLGDDVHARQARIEDRVVHDIEASLRSPPRTYHQHDRDMQK